MVMEYLHRDRFSSGTYHKLQARKISPCCILCKISDNTFTIDFPMGMNISNMFNVANLYQYHPPDVAVEVIDQIRDGIC